MPYDVICLRPETDFLRVGVTPPSDLSIAYRAPDDDGLAGLMKTARALVIPAVGPKLVSALFKGTGVKLVQVTGAGVDRLDESAMREFGIMVANVAGGADEAVAEYVITSTMALLRRFFWADANIKSGLYSEFRKQMVADNLSGFGGLTVGVVGLGSIGLTVAREFHHKGCHIVYYDPAPANRDAAQKLGARSLSLDELLRVADVVTLHVPLIPATKNLIGAAELAAMKPGSILINAARGGIVDEAALAASLISGHLGGAAVDVYSSEPPPLDNPLLALKEDVAHRLLLTPHIAGVTRQSWAFLFRTAWENVERVLTRNELPLNRVF